MTIPSLRRLLIRKSTISLASFESSVSECKRRVIARQKQDFAVSMQPTDDDDEFEIAAVKDKVLDLVLLFSAVSSNTLTI
jgi:hypothetical protein